MAKGYIGPLVLFYCIMNGWSFYDNNRPTECSVIFGKSLKMIPQICIMFDSPQPWGPEFNDLNGPVVIDTASEVPLPDVQWAKRPHYLPGSSRPKASRVDEIWTSWWLNQPLWKILVKFGSSSPIFGVKIKNVWNHHPDEIWNPYKTWLTFLRMVMEPINTMTWRGDWTSQSSSENMTGCLGNAKIERFRLS